MNLFTVKHQLHHTSLNPLELKTPLGDLFFDCQIFNESLLDTHPTKMESFQSGNTITSWISENYIVEFIKLNFKPKLPTGMKVDDCIFAVWRIKSLRKIAECNFTCRLENEEGSPESGEGLASQSFENNDYKLNIGTEDEDYLQQRAESQNWLPLHFKDKISTEQIDYLKSGIKITLPELLPNESLQIHFIVSWSSKKNPEISTWYAVDQSPMEILEKAGIQ